MKKLITTAILLLLMYGCVNHEDVIGTYQIKFPYAEGDLVLNADGTYQNNYTFNKGVLNQDEGKSFTQRGKWSFEKEIPVFPLYKVTLMEFNCFWNWQNPDKPETNNNKVHTSFQVQNSGESMKLIVNEDLNIFYKKIK